MANFDPKEKGGAYALIFSMTVTIVFMIYISTIHPGVAIDVPKEAQEQEQANPQ